MLPTRQELVDEAQVILETAPGGAMYAPVLATAIAGRLNERAPAPRYEPPSWEMLLAALRTDARYRVTFGVAGLPIVERTKASRGHRVSDVRRIEPWNEAELDTAS